MSRKLHRCISVHDFIRVLPCPRRACLWDDSILSSFLLYTKYEKIDEYFNEKIYFINEYFVENESDTKKRVTSRNNPLHFSIFFPLFPFENIQ